MNFINSFIMKTLRLFAAMTAITLFSMSAIAQPKENWKERIQSEKIAFITLELDLTPEEAQVFWPVYNQIEKNRGESQKAVMASYRALLEALKSDTATEKEIDKLLDEYLAAKLAQKNVGKDDVTKFRKVLPGKKVAKLYVAEENFRRNHLRNMKGGHNGQGHAKAPGHKPGPRK